MPGDAVVVGRHELTDDRVRLDRRVPTVHEPVLGRSSIFEGDAGGPIRIRELAREIDRLVNGAAPPSFGVEGQRDVDARAPDRVEQDRSRRRDGFGVVDQHRAKPGAKLRPVEGRHGHGDDLARVERTAGAQRVAIARHEGREVLPAFRYPVGGRHRRDLLGRQGRRQIRPHRAGELSGEGTTAHHRGRAWPPTLELVELRGEHFGDQTALFGSHDEGGGAHARDVAPHDVERETGPGCHRKRSRNQPGFGGRSHHSPPHISGGAGTRRHEEDLARAVVGRKPAPALDERRGLTRSESASDHLHDSDASDRV